MSVEITIERGHCREGDATKDTEQLITVTGWVEQDHHHDPRDPAFEGEATIDSAEDEDGRPVTLTDAERAQAFELLAAASGTEPGDFDNSAADWEAVDAAWGSY